MNKYIEKILDKYFAKKLLIKIENKIIFYDLDKKIRLENDTYFIDVKPKKFNDKFYKTLFSFNERNAVELYINYKELKINKIIDRLRWEL